MTKKGLYVGNIGRLGFSIGFVDSIRSFFSLRFVKDGERKERLIEELESLVGEELDEVWTVVEKRKRKIHDRILAELEELDDEAITALFWKTVIFLREHRN